MVEHRKFIFDHTMAELFGNQIFFKFHTRK